MFRKSVCFNFQIRTYLVNPLAQSCSQTLGCSQRAHIIGLILKTEAEQTSENQCLR